MVDTKIISFENFLSQMFVVANIPDWRIRYRPKADEWHNESLQGLLAHLSIPMHIRILAGLNKYGYRGLDLYTRVVVGSRPVALYGAHDVVYSSWFPHAREVPYTPNWWQYRYRYHWGQQSTVCGWLMKNGVDLGSMQKLLDKNVDQQEDTD